MQTPQPSTSDRDAGPSPARRRFAPLLAVRDAALIVLVTTGVLLLAGQVGPMAPLVCALVVPVVGFAAAAAAAPGARRLHTVVVAALVFAAAVVWHVFDRQTSKPGQHAQIAVDSGGMLGVYALLCAAQAAVGYTIATALRSFDRRPGA